VHRPHGSKQHGAVATPASNTRTAGGRGWMLASSKCDPVGDTHFSLQVLTNNRYFCRLSKKRKLRCGSGVPAAPASREPTAKPGRRVAVRMRASKEMAGVAAITAGRACAPRFEAMKFRMRSSVSW